MHSNITASHPPCCHFWKGYASSRCCGFLYQKGQITLDTLGPRFVHRQAYANMLFSESMSQQLRNLFCRISWERRFPVLYTYLCTYGTFQPTYSSYHRHGVSYLWQSSDSLLCHSLSRFPSGKTKNFPCYLEAVWSWKMDEKDNMGNGKKFGCGLHLHRPLCRLIDGATDWLQQILSLNV